MKFTRLSLAAAFATVAFAEKYAFFAKPEGGDKMIPLTSQPRGDYFILSYNPNKEEEPVIFDKVDNGYKTQVDGLNLGVNGQFYTYGKNLIAVEFEVDDKGLVRDLASACFINSDDLFIYSAPNAKGKGCLNTQLYVKVVDDDDDETYDCEAPLSVEASSISSEASQPESSAAVHESSAAVHESSAAVHESSSVHVQESSSIAAATEHSNIVSESHVSSNDVFPTSVTASSVAASSASASSSSESGDVCACMEASLSCVAKPDANPSQFEAIFNWACGQSGVDCKAVQESGIYGACSQVQRVGYVMNSYHLQQNRTDGSCVFSGVGTIRNPTTGQCSVSGSGSGSVSASAGSSAFAGVSSGSASASASASASNSVVASSASNSASSASASSSPESGDVCACMEASLSCVAKPDANPSQFEAIFNWACGQSGVDCKAVQESGIYGACSQVQRVGYVMNSYHLQQNRTDGSCVFSGVGTIRNPTTGQCSVSGSGSGAASASAGSSASGSGSASVASVASVAAGSASAAASVAAGSDSAASVAAGSDYAAASVAAGSASAAASVAPSQWNASTVTRESTETSTVCTKCQAGESSLVTVWKTYTDYTTYCPSETTLTITKCDEECHPSTVTVTSATTLTVTGKCIVPETTVASEHPVETGSSAHPVESVPAHPVGSAPEHPAETSVANKPVDSGNGSNPSKPVDSGNGSNPSKPVESGNGSAPGKPVQSSSAPKPINGKGNGNNNGNNVNNKPSSGAPNPTMVSVASNPKSSSSSERDTTQTLTSSVTLRPVSSFDNGASKNGAFGALVLGFAALLL